MLRNGTYCRSNNADRLLYFSKWKYVYNPDDDCDLLVDNAKDFNIVWDQFEVMELFKALNYELLEPGQFVEIKGGMPV